MTSRRRWLVVLAPWLPVLAVALPIAWRAPSMPLLFPAALFIPFDVSPQALPSCAIAGWMIYVGLGSLAVTRVSQRAFWLSWSCGVVLLTCNVGALLFAIASLKGLQ